MDMEVKCTLRNNDVVKVAENSRQAALRGPFEDAECFHCRTVVVEIERDEADGKTIRQSGPRWHSFRDITDHKLGRSQARLKGGHIHLEETLGPDMRQVAIVTRFRHTFASVEAECLDFDLKLAADFA